MTNPNSRAIIGMKICAVRHDASVGFEEFADLVLQLVGSSTSAARPAAAAAAPPAQKAEPARRKPRAATPPADPPRRRRGRTSALTDEVKARLHDSYEKAVSGNGGKPPRGLVANLAKEFGLSPSTVYRLAPNGAKSPADDSDDDEPDPAAHRHSSLCWCRKGPNNEANPWCSNAPRSAAPITLSDPRSTMSRPAHERPRN